MAKTTPKETPMAEEKKDPLESVLAKQRSSQSNTISPTPEEAEGLEEKLFKKEEEKDGVVTLTSSVSEEEAEKAVKANKEVPPFINMRHALDRFPGQLDLTKGGTLNNDLSLKMDIKQEELNELAAKTAGANPLPNRIGNELTNIENGFRADTFARAGTSLAGVADVLKKLREGNRYVNNEEKKQLEDAEKALRAG